MGLVFLFFFLKIFCLFNGEREREHKQAERQTEGEGEAGSPLSREPDAGLDPRPWDHGMGLVFLSILSPCVF